MLDLARGKRSDWKHMGVIKVQEIFKEGWDHVYDWVLENTLVTEPRAETLAFSFSYPLGMENQATNLPKAPTVPFSIQLINSLIEFEKISK